MWGQKENIVTPLEYSAMHKESHSDSFGWRCIAARINVLRTQCSWHRAQNTCSHIDREELTTYRPTLSCSTREPFSYLETTLGKNRTAANIQLHMQITVNHCIWHTFTISEYVPWHILKTTPSQISCGNPGKCLESCHNCECKNHLASGCILGVCLCTNVKAAVIILLCSFLILLYCNFRHTFGMTFRDASVGWLIHHFGPDLDILTTIGCIAMQFCTDIHPWLFIYHEVKMIMCPLWFIWFVSKSLQN